MLFTLTHVLQRSSVWWAYYQKHKDSIRPTVVDNIVKLLSCGLSVRGYKSYVCSNSNCNHTKFVPFTCKGRFCPSCGKKATSAWVAKQQTILPKTTWQHITFTMPSELWRFFKLNRQLLNHLSSLASQCVLKIAHNKNIIPGIFAALHTFGRDLKFNVHIHLSTTCGGLSLDNSQWKNLYFKKDLLMRMWRYRVVTLLRQAYQNGQLKLPTSLAQLCQTDASFYAWLDKRYQKGWIVHCTKPSLKHSYTVNYLGRYIKRPPIAQSRLRHYDGNIVIFNYLNHKTKQHKDFTCSANNFIERFIQHIPDKNFRLIRYYGFLANRIRGKLLPVVYQCLEQIVDAYHNVSWDKLMKRTLGFNPLQCILCKSRMVLSSITIGKSTAQLHDYHLNLALMKPII